MNFECSSLDRVQVKMGDLSWQPVGEFVKDLSVREAKKKCYMMYSLAQEEMDIVVIKDQIAELKKKTTTLEYYTRA